MRTKSYDEFLLGQLKDTELAAEYLTSAIEGGSTAEFLIALRNVAEAHGGIAAVSESARLNRQTMYRTLSDEGNPTLSTLMSVLKVVGLNISFVAAKPQ